MGDEETEEDAEWWAGEGDASASVDGIREVAECGCRDEGRCDADEARVDEDDAWEAGECDGEMEGGGDGAEGSDGSGWSCGESHAQWSTVWGMECMEEHGMGDEETEEGAEWGSDTNGAAAAVDGIREVAECGCGDEGRGDADEARVDENDAWEAGECDGEMA